MSEPRIGDMGRRSQWAAGDRLDDIVEAAKRRKEDAALSAAIGKHFGAQMAAMRQALSGKIKEPA